MNINKQEFLARAQLSHDTLKIWIEEEWLIPGGTANEMAFSGADLARARLIQDLMIDLGVNAEGVGIVLNLVDQVHGLRRALAGALQTANGSSKPRGGGA